jgi:hypothetical protein
MTIKELYHYTYSTYRYIKRHGKIDNVANYQEYLECWSDFRDMVGDLQRRTDKRSVFMWLHHFYSNAP